MNADRYVCCDERRRALLAGPGAPANISGIDYVEVAVGALTSDPTTITIVLVKPLALPAAALGAANIKLTGGVRFPAPKIDPNIVASPGAGSVDRYVVTVPGGQPTDFSAYRLALVTAPDNDTPPSFIDPRLSAVDFSFSQSSETSRSWSITAGTFAAEIRRNAAPSFSRRRITWRNFAASPPDSVNFSRSTRASSPSLTNVRPKLA